LHCVVGEATARLLEGGCAFIVGAVLDDGGPYATRGWGMTLLPGEPVRARLLLAADDAVVATALAAGRAIAVTAADVPSLRSVQLKGRSLGVTAGTDDDRARAARFADAFFGDIARTDGTDRRVLERMVPADYVACTITIEELFNQTPGPEAGAVMERRAP
jgi:hypothetical protein